VRAHIADRAGQPFCGRVLFEDLGHRQDPFGRTPGASSGRIELRVSMSSELSAAAQKPRHPESETVPTVM